MLCVGCKYCTWKTISAFGPNSCVRSKNSSNRIQCIQFIRFNSHISVHLIFVFERIRCTKIRKKNLITEKKNAIKKLLSIDRQKIKKNKTKTKTVTKKAFTWHLCNRVLCNYTQYVSIAYRCPSFVVVASSDVSHTSAYCAFNVYAV